MGVQLAAENAGFTEMDNINLTDSELVFHVRNALKAALEGDCDNYYQLVGVMHQNKRSVPEEVALLVTSLKALAGAVSCIDILHHRSLLSAIFGMSLWDYGTDVMDALLELVLSLAASNGQYVDLCLGMLVNNFMPPLSFAALLKQPRGIARKNQVLDRVHSTLKGIADLVPLSPLRLEKIVREGMPNMLSKEFEFIVIYVENMLRLEIGAMGELVGRTMFAAIIDKLIDMDVEIAWDDILQDDFNKGIFEMELEEFEGPADDVQHSDDELQRDAWIERFFGGNVVAEKLDSLMVLTFEHLKSCGDSGRIGQVFETLLQSFQKTVLTAYKSKFAQFVVFYACSLDPENCGRQFASMLVNIFTSNVYPEWRMSAVAYLASYLSRAKFLPTSFIATTLESVVSWCYDYCKNQEGDINPRVHRVFYAGCQAVMYVLCFRMRSMLLVPRLKSQLFLMRIEDILRHPLNPLAVCLPSIVEEFLQLAKTTHLFSLTKSFSPDGCLESELSIAFGGMERLDMFFPFDPCLLKKSDRFIRPNYVYWSMVRSSYDDVDDDEGSTSDDDVMEAHASGNGTEIVDDGSSRGLVEDDHGLDEFDYSLDKMSITPKSSFGFLKYPGELQGCTKMPSRLRPSTSPESL